MRDEVLQFVPVGIENRQSGSVIWRRYGQWARPTVRNRLVALTEAGTVVMTALPTRTGTENFFHREAT